MQTGRASIIFVLKISTFSASAKTCRAKIAHSKQNALAQDVAIGHITLMNAVIIICEICIIR